MRYPKSGSCMLMDSFVRYLSLSDMSCSVMSDDFETRKVRAKLPHVAGLFSLLRSHFL